MINVRIDKKKELITHHTLIVVDGKFISLSVTKHLGYGKPYQVDLSLTPPKDVDLFEDLFYWTKEQYLDPKLHHLAYTRMRENNFYYQSGLVYEIQYEEVSVTSTYDSKGNLHYITLSTKDRNYPYAVPPESFKEERYDYITNDSFYHYDCKKDEYQGIAIVVKKIKQ